ncbi:MAG: AI-2E family transporter [Pseudomonadota bacterium]
MPNEPSVRPTSHAVPGWFMAVVTTPIAVGLLYYGRDFLIPIAIALLLFILMTALADWIDTMKIGQWSPPLWLARVIGIGLVLAGFAVIAMILADEAENIGEVVSKYSTRLDSISNRIETLLGAQIIETIKRTISELDVGAWFTSLAGGVSGLIASFALVILYIAFLTSERQAFAGKLPLMATNEAEAEHLEEIVHSISNGVKQYMLINAVTSAISGVVAYVIFSLIGLDFAALLALTVFLVGFIPNIGAFIGIALPSLVALLQFDTWTPFLIVVFGYGAADQLISNVIQPAMQGKSLNLSTFMVMVSLSFWGTVWGGVGAFLAVPLTVVIMIIAAEFASLRPLVILFSGDGKLPNTQSRN